MSKPKASPIGNRIRVGKHARVVENTDYTDLMALAPPKNRKQRREQERRRRSL
jgi:hypothetical protein